MKEISVIPDFVYPVQDDRRRELPCKDMDLDCLPDNTGSVPFGSYLRCFLYDPDKGSCPFLPIEQ